MRELGYEGSYDAVRRYASAWQQERNRAVQVAIGVDWEGRRNYMVPTEVMKDRWERADLDDLLDGQGRTAFLLRFTLSHPGLDTTIVGTSSLEHLRANLAVAAQGPLPDDVVAETKRRLAAVGG